MNRSQGIVQRLPSVVDPMPVDNNPYQSSLHVQSLREVLHETEVNNLIIDTFLRLAVNQYNESNTRCCTSLPFRAFEHYQKSKSYESVIFGPKAVHGYFREVNFLSLTFILSFIHVGAPFFCVSPCCLLLLSMQYFPFPSPHPVFCS